jgi:hypothetical protein
MGRNAAFGRPPASERLREWWDARSKTSRQNIYLALVVGALFVAIVMAATARDKVPASRRVIASRPQQQPTTTLDLPTPSTVNVGGLGGLGGTVTAADLFGLSTTTTSPAPATTSPPPARAATTVATTAAPAPATTVTNPDVIFTTVAPATTTTTQAPVTTTTPPATTTTVPPTTTTTLLPLSVPTLLAG